LKYLISIVFLLYSHLSFADQQNLNFRLVDQTNRSVQNARIYIEGLDLDIKTDSLGRFSFTGKAEGPLIFNIQYKNYQYVIEVENASYIGETLLSLPKEVVERIMVTANVTPKEVLEMARPVVLLEGEELLSKRGSNISETLAQEPGISSSSFGSGAGRPVIRGLTGSRLTLLNNGIGTLDVSSTSPDHAISTEPLLAKQVEVLKGPATLLYGENAIGGVINVVNERIPKSLPSKRMSGGVEFRFDTAKRENASVAQVLLNANKVNLYVDGYNRNSQDINLPSSLGGTLFNSDISANGGALGIAWVEDNSDFLGISISKANNDYGLPTLANDDEFVSLLIDQNRVDVAGQFTSPMSSIDSVNIKLANNDYEHVEIEDGEIGTRFVNDATEFRVDVLHDFFSNWKSVSGIHLLRRSYSAIGDEAFVPPSSSNSTGLFIVGERPLKSVDIELGFRINQSTIDSDVLTDDKTYTTFSSSLRGLKDIGDEYVIAASFSHAQRPPSVEELLSNGPHFATQSFEIGEIDLTQETSNNFDLSLRKKAGDFRFELNAFFNEYSDFIFERPTGTFVDDLPEFRFTQEDARFTGLEFDFDWGLVTTLPFQLSINGMFDYVRGRLVQGGDLPRIPPLRVGLGLEVITNDLSIGMNMLRYLSQNRVADFESTTSGYTIVNIDINFSFFTDSVEWLFFMRGTNLFDDEIINHSSFIKDIAPEAGRALNAGVRISF